MAKNSKLFSWGQVTVYWNFHWLNFYMEIYGSNVGTCGGWLVSFSLVYGNSRHSWNKVYVHQRFHGWKSRMHDHLCKPREENVEIFWWYIAEISSIGASGHDIWKINIGSPTFYQFIVNFTDFSGFVSILSFYRQYIAIFWAVKWGSMRSTRLCDQTFKNALRLPLGQVRPLIYNLH